MVLILAAAGTPAGVCAAEELRVRQLRTQVAGGFTYFHVQLDPPGDMDPELHKPPLKRLPRYPRLVPQDDRTWAVYLYLPLRPQEANKGAAKAGGKAGQPGKPVPMGDHLAEPPMVPVSELEFVGRAAGLEKARFLLIYPTQKKEEPGADAERAKKAPVGWVETPVTLDLAGARKVAVPAEAGTRRPDRPVAADDLEGRWAVAQAVRFAVLEAQVRDFGFYGFAREATGRKYGVAALALSTPRTAASGPLDQQLYEITTGPAAVMESLQRQRMRTAETGDRGERRRKLEDIPPIQMAAYPWKQQRANKKPVIESLARFVPADNYYAHFRDVRKLLELAGQSEQWAGELLRLYDPGRDAGLLQRYERQLCIRSSALGRLLGPQVVGAVALTGSDPYLREGSDVAVLFQTRSRRLLLAGLEPFLDEARKEWGERLRQGSEEQGGIRIESFVTPLREVSLYRAWVEDVVVYANSPVGIRRILDTFGGRHRRLADAPDYQYVRTVFRGDDPAEDGFAYLSEAFLRQLMGPASKIKEKRRLEALTSLAMVTHGALFTAWENARPGQRQRPVAPSGIKKEELYAPGGQDVAWDPGRQLALSDLYNTLHFATPLIEIPIDRITDAEDESYRRFREQYQGPASVAPGIVGMRLSLRESRVSVETFLLPLVKSKTYYTELQEEIGGESITLDPEETPSTTLLQLKTHINPRSDLRRWLTSAASILGGIVSFDCLGDGGLVRLDDSPLYDKWVEELLKWDEGDEAMVDPRDSLDLLFQTPITLGVEVRNPLVLGAVLGTVRATVLAALPGVISWGPLEKPYRGVSIVRIGENAEGIGQRSKPQGEMAEAMQLLRELRKEMPLALYYAMVDRVLYVSMSETAIKATIDASVARREKKEAARAELVQVHGSLYLAPGAAVKAQGCIRFYVETLVQEMALENEPLLYLLYHAGLVGPQASDKEVQTAARHYLGFAPVSLDGVPYVYSSRSDEVTNRRHGTLRQPQVHRDLEKGSSVARLLEQLHWLRGDLRFEENGIYTALTLTRKKPAR
jgi:hypothetical protein